MGTQQMTIIIGTEVDIDTWTFKHRQYESELHSRLETLIGDFFQDVHKDDPINSKVNDIDFEYGEPTDPHDLYGDAMYEDY